MIPSNAGLGHIAGAAGHKREDTALFQHLVLTRPSFKTGVAGSLDQSIRSLLPFDSVTQVFFLCQVKMAQTSTNPGIAIPVSG